MLLTRDSPQTQRHAQIKSQEMEKDISCKQQGEKKQELQYMYQIKQKGLEERIVYPARLSFKYEGGIKQFPDKQKLREFVSHKPPLKAILQGLL